MKIYLTERKKVTKEFHSPSIAYPKYFQSPLSLERNLEQENCISRFRCTFKRRYSKFQGEQKYISDNV